MIEIHPFGTFVPTNARHLVLGSFTGKLVGNNTYDWFYGTIKYITKFQPNYKYNNL